MRERDTEDDAGAEAHDFLLDEIGNHYHVVWNGVIPTEDDEYPVQIKRYEGVYLVWAMEYDDEGYFLCYVCAIARCLPLNPKGDFRPSWTSPSTLAQGGCRRRRYGGASTSGTGRARHVSYCAGSMQEARS